MIVKVKFKGEDGSCGYRLNNPSYILDLKFKRQNGTMNDVLWIRCVSHTFCEPVPYESMKAFLNNWDIL